MRIEMQRLVVFNLRIYDEKLAEAAVGCCLGVFEVAADCAGAIAIRPRS
jgi:hypothetical protein